MMDKCQLQNMIAALAQTALEDGYKSEAKILYALAGAIACDKASYLAEKITPLIETMLLELNQQKQN